MKISYYPGCTLKSNAKNFEDSAICSMKEFGIEMEELPKWNCCGTVFSLASDDLMHHVAPVRVLLRTREGGSDSLFTLCSMCYHTLKLSNIRVKENPGELEKINNLMYKEEITYDGGVTVYHGLSFLKEKIGFEKIREKINPVRDIKDTSGKSKISNGVKVNLGSLKVAPYYGCLLLRPKEVSIDPNMENPTIMSEFIGAVGAIPVEFSHQTECCGSYLTVDEKDLVVERSYEILKSARYAGADIVLTSCPLCQFNLDDRQREVKKKYPEFEEIPILYFTQLLALAMGLDEESLRFDLNWVDPNTVLEDKNILVTKKAVKK